MLSRSCCSVVVFTTSLYWRRLCWSADGPKLEQPATRDPRRRAESIRMLRTVRFGMDSSHRFAPATGGKAVRFARFSTHGYRPTRPLPLRDDHRTEDERP